MGTFRKDRVGGCPLSPMKYAERGEYEVYNAVDSAGKLLVFATGSNCIGFDPLGSVRRWIKTEIKIVGTPAPAMVLQYNSSVGGADVMDHAVSCNHPRIISKRWWFPLLTFFVQSALYNSYLIYWKAQLQVKVQLISTSSVLLYLVLYDNSAKIPRS